MIRAGEGTSRAEAAGDAGREAVEKALAAAGVEEADLVFLFASEASTERAGEVLEAAVDAAGTESVVGCTGMGVLSSQAGEIERAKAVTAVAIAGDAIEALPFIVESEDAVEELTGLLLPYSGEGAVLTLFPDVTSTHPAELIGSLAEALPDLPVVGGAAAGSPLDPTATQWCGNTVTTGGISGVLLRGDFTAVTGVAQGCQPFGQAYAITRAEENVVYEIAFAPAVDALKEALDTLTPEQKENVGPSIFAGLAMDEYATERGRGDFLIRNLIGLSQEDGSLAIGERVEVGQTIQFNLRTADAAHEDLEQAMGALARNMQGMTPRFALYFNCLGRGFGLFGRPNHDVETIRKHLGELPMAGFFGNAEFAPVGGRNYVHSYTGGIVVVAE